MRCEPRLEGPALTARWVTAKMATDAPSAAAAPGSPPGERRGSARRASLQNLPPPSAEVLEQNRRETRRRSSVLGSMGLVGEPKEEKGKKPEDLVMTGVTRRGSEAAARPKLRRKSSLILSEKERKRLVSVAVTDSDEAKRASSAAFYDTNEPSIAFEASAQPQPFSLARGYGRHTSALTSPRACTRRPRAPTRIGAWRPCCSRTSPTSRRASASSPTRPSTRRSRRAHPRSVEASRARESESPSQDSP